MANRDENPFANTVQSLRASAAAVRSEPPPAKEGQTTTEAIAARVASNQAAIVDAIGQSLETVGEVVVELRASVDEDERVRVSVRELTKEVRQLGRLVRGAVYASCLMVAVAVAVVILSSIHDWRLVNDMYRTLTTVSDDTARTLEVIVKQADAHARSVEAKAAPTPSAEQAALEAALDVQEEAAETQIEVARTRQQAPPPEAEKALKRARARKEQFRNGGALQPPTPPAAQSAPRQRPTLPEAQSAPRQWSTLPEVQSAPPPALK